MYVACTTLYGKFRALSLRSAACVALMFSALALSNVNAQTAYNFNPPELRLSDKVGVNLVSGLPLFVDSPVEIGPAGNLLQQTLSFDGLTPTNFEFSDQFRGGVSKEASPWIRCPGGTWCPNYLVHVGASAERFYLLNGQFGSFQQRGSTLVKHADGTLTYTTRDGVRYRASNAVPSLRCSASPVAGDCASFTEVIYPSGLTLSLNYSPVSYGGGLIWRLSSVLRSDGWGLRYFYDAVSQSGAIGYRQAVSPTRVTAYNAAIDYCAPLAAACAFSREWPTATFSWSGSVAPAAGPLQFYITNAGGQTSRYTNSWGSDQIQRITAFKAASSSGADTATISYSDFQWCAVIPLDPFEDVSPSILNCNVIRQKLVSSYSTAGGTWTYTHQNPSVPQQTRWVTRSVGPEGNFVQVDGTTLDGRSSYTMTRSSSEGDADYSFDQPNRLLSHASRVDGTRWAFSYDARGNLLEKTQFDTTGATGGPSFQRAGYDTTCSNPITCNKPNWIQDANGNTTHLVFDPIHGGLIKETLPPDKHGIRPERRYIYTPRYAWLKDAAGGYVRAVRPIWLLSEISTCISGSAAASGVGCAAGPPDEVRTVFDYGPDSGPSNLLLRGQSNIADGQTLLTCYSYNERGNRISQTTPNAALGNCP